MPSASDVNLGYGVISPIHNSKAKQAKIVLQKSNSIKAFKKGFQLPKVKSPQKEEEEKEMKYTLAFPAEGKKQLVNSSAFKVILTFYKPAT